LAGKDTVRAFSRIFEDLLTEPLSMVVYPIVHRWTGIPIALLEGESFPAALERAAAEPGKLLYANLASIRVPGVMLPRGDLRGADLSRSDLSGGMLAEVDLRTASLVAARLRETCLHAADLRQADLRSADLRGADLQEARLAGADLRRALLQGAKLRGAVLDWRWSELPLEILRQHHEAATRGSKVVAALAFDDNAHEFAWLKALSRLGSAADWALRILSRWAHPSDNASALMRSLMADLPSRPRASGEPDAPPSSEAKTQMLWTRRAAGRVAVGRE
jgi:hypothetical protein